jgi:cytochrome c-type biogenesis protein CcmE
MRGVGSSPARLVIALSVAAALAVFVFYTALAGAGVPQILPSKVHHYVGQNVVLVGTVVATRGSAYTASGMHLVLRDPDGSARVPVVYHGSVPDLYKVGRVVVVDGKLTGGRFLADNGSLSTKCPSHYSPGKSSNT